MGLAKTFLAIGIAIIFAVFVSYGLHVIYEPPKDYSYGSNDCYKTYNCQQQISDCQKQYNYSDTGYQDCYSSVTQSTQYKTCQELYTKCNEEFQKKTPQYIHSRNSFYILLVIGIITIIAGILLTSLEGIGSGLMGGGILVVLWSLIYTRQYWFTLNKYIKLIALGIVLAILIYLGYKKLENKLKQ
jgi:hypothetical protein